VPASPTAPPRPTALALPAAVLLGLLLPLGAGAQTTTPPPAAKADAPAAAPAPPPGPAYAAREKLIAYVEFDGLDAHEEGWRKTAAFRMLNDTPLGGMLEEVGVALLERASAWLPNRKINGADGVAIVKHLARKGFVAAFNADPSAPKGYRGVLILRGATTKESKGLLSRLVVSFMDPASKHRLERKGSRSVVVVPPPGGDGKPADEGWAWWAEGGDFGIALARPSDADACLACLEGKAASAVGYEPVEAVAKADAGLTPALKAFLDATTDVRLPGAPPTPPVDSGVQRIEYRWGFQDEALVGATRLVAPKPRRGALAFLDEPSFEAKKLLPIPDGVEYFASVSLKPDRWAALISGLFSGSPGARAQYDAMVEGVRSRGRSDFEKDFLGNLGPRAVAYLAPSTSAATVDEPASNLADPTAILSAMGPQLPKPVLVAEVADPAKFSRALEAVMQEANRQIKAVAAERIAEAVKAEAANPAPGGPGFPGGPGARVEEPGGERKDRKRDENAIPEFRLLPSGGAETNRTYMLNVPTSSSIKLPAGFRPSVRLEGHYLAISTSSEAARVAVEQLQRKPWTPAEDVARAIDRAPDSTFVLLYGDFREATSASLASLPGSLQTGINTAIAASERILKGQAGGSQPGSSGPQGMRMPMGPGGGGSSPGGSFNPQYPGMMLGPGGPGMGPQGGQPAQAGPDFSMIQIRVDPAHLPKADELKSLMFPSTTVVSVDDDSVRIVTRGAFPDVTALVGAKGFLPALLTPPIAAARTAAAAKAAAAQAQAQPGQGGNPAPQPGGNPVPGPGMGRPGGGNPAPQPGVNPAPPPGGARRDR